MSQYTATAPQLRQPIRLLSQSLFVLAGGIILAFIFILLAIVGYETRFAGHIYPGVSVAGLDLSDLSPEEAVPLLSNYIDYPMTGRIVFQDGNKVWVAKPVEIGLFLDSETSVWDAYQVGRQGGLIKRLSDQRQAWTRGIDLPPKFVYNEQSARRFLEGIAAQVDRPVIEADLGLDGIDVQVRSGQIGREIDITSTLSGLDSHLESLTDAIIPLVIEETPPLILDTTEQAEIAREILSTQLRLRIPDKQKRDPGPWTFDPPDLAGLLAIERVNTEEGPQYQVGLDSAQLRAFLESIAPDLTIQPVNSRFTFNEDNRKLELLEPAIIGRKLLVEETIETINRKLSAGEHKISLVMKTVTPDIDDNTRAKELGITDLIHAETSYFYGSSAARVQNIQAAASRFHGLLVAPGETFSMASALGDVSLDNGYAEALIIYGNRTIKGVGGGVCQVSTTLFRTAFFGGYPIVERNPHAYRVYYYELEAGNRQDSKLAGLDATVYVPLVDMKFTNNSPNWLLMETYVNPSAKSLTWKFYSTADSRNIDWHTTGLQNRVDPPEPLYVENPDLKKGEIKQVDWAVEGADVTVTRTVTRDGQVLADDIFTTRYIPWQAVYEYGPGTKGIPKPKPTGEPAG